MKNPGCPSCGYAGWIPVSLPGAASAAPLRRRVGCCSRCSRCADPAESSYAGPASGGRHIPPPRGARGPPRRLRARRSRRRRRRGRAGGRRDSCWCETLLVEDPGRDRPRAPCATACRPPHRSRRQLRGVEDEGRRHQTLHPPPRLERGAEEIDLAEHAVQVQVEARGASRRSRGRGCREARTRCRRDRPSRDSWCASPGRPRRSSARRA